MALYAGQGGLVHETRPAADIVAEIVTDAEARCTASAEPIATKVRHSKPGGGRLTRLGYWVRDSSNIYTAPVF
jgi:hypothetical protein